MSTEEGPEFQTEDNTPSYKAYGLHSPQETGHLR